MIGLFQRGAAGILHLVWQRKDQTGNECGQHKSAPIPAQMSSPRKKAACANPVEWRQANTLKLCRVAGIGQSPEVCTTTTSRMRNRLPSRYAIKKRCLNGKTARNKRDKTQIDLAAQAHVSFPFVVETHRNALIFGHIHRHFMAQPAFPEQHIAHIGLHIDEFAQFGAGIAAALGRGHHHR